MANHASARRSRYMATLLASTALGTVAVPEATAQGVTSQQASENAIVEEIVVRGVARRFRPEEQRSATGLTMALIETPQSVSVLTSEMLATVNAKSVYEATDLVPGVQRSGYGFGLEQIVMRGIFNGTRRINGIEIANGFTSVKAHAAERTEVVRGPATAIYGVTGSFGGELNTILKQPSPVRALELGAELGSYDSQRYTLDATGPLVEDGSVSARFAAEYHEYDLPLDIRNTSFPNYETMLLGSINWDISTRSTLRYTHIYQRRNGDPWDGGALIQNDDGTLSIPDVDPEQWYFSHPEDSNEKLKVHFGILEFEHELVNGWRAETKLAYGKHDEELQYFYPFGPFGAYSLADDEAYIYTYDIERSGEELTFNQSLGGDFDLMGREHQFFVALEYKDTLSPQRFQLLNSAFQGFGTIDMYSDGNFDGVQPRFADGSEFNPIPGSRNDVFGVRQILETDSEDLKISAQFLLNPADRLQLLGGVIYHDNSTKTTIPFNAGEQNDPPEVTKTDFSELVYRFAATYDLIDDWGIVDDARIYYSYSEGFQPQTFTDGDGNTVSAPREMDQHEVGIKAELFGGAVGTSLAVFNYEITNIQVSSAFLGSFGGFGSAVLEGSQKATGVEWEMVGEVLPGWNVSANYAYIDAEIQNPNNTRSTPPRTTPKHSGAITSTYEFVEGPLGGLRIGATFKASGNYSFVEGTSNVDRFGEPPSAGSHERLDLHLSYAPRAGRWQNLEVYLNWMNVFDKDIIVAKQGNPGFGIMFIDQQRIVGGLRYTFD